MLNLSEDSNPELKVKTLFRKVEKFFSLSNDINSQEKYSHGRWSENIAEQVHQIADQLPNSGERNQQLLDITLIYSHKSFWKY